MGFFQRVAFFVVHQTTPFHPWANTNPADQWQVRNPQSASYILSNFIEATRSGSHKPQDRQQRWVSPNLHKDSNNILAGFEAEIPMQTAIVTCFPGMPQLAGTLGVFFHL
jgi:hypothetical protein